MNPAMSTAPSTPTATPETDPEKLRFLGLVSHELRTPLNAIIGFSNMIEQQMLGPVGSEEYVEFAREIQASGKSLLRLIDDLITSARAEAEGLKPAQAHVDLGTAIASAVRDLTPAAQRKGQKLANRVGDSAPALWGDGRAVRQAIGALLDNALKFTPENGDAWIEGAPAPGGDYRLVVGDTGPGFAEGRAAELTQAFRQEDDGVNRSFEGAGLGLYLVSQLVAMHDGRMELANAPEGGARVALVFPRERLVAAFGDDDLTVMTEDDVSAGAPAMLELTHDGERRHIFHGDDGISFGRRAGAGGADDADLLVEDRRASRDHGQVISFEGRFYLVDESRRGSYIAPEGGPVEHVHLNVSAPLEGSGVISLGDKPDAEGVARIAYRVTAKAADAS